MKKSIGILAAVLFSASVYSQPYSGPDRGLTGNPEGDSLRSRQVESGAPTASGGFPGVESSTSSSSSSDSQNNGLTHEQFDSSVSTSSTSSDNSSSSATLEQQEVNPQASSREKQGLSLDDQEAADVLRQSGSDDPDMANRNNAERAQREGLAQQSDDLNSDFSARKGSDQDPDMIYEEWYLFGPIQMDQQSVGAPAESESGSGSSSSSSLDNGSKSEMDYANPEAQFDSDVQESGELNDSRIYNGADYWRDNSGSPAASESGSSKSSRDHCDTDKDHAQGSPGESVTGSDSSSSSSLSQQDREPESGIKDNDQSNNDTDRENKAKDQSEGSAASGDTSSSKSGHDTHGETSGYPETTTIPEL